jgi:hypothetical protein
MLIIAQHGRRILGGGWGDGGAGSGLIG